MTEHPRAVGRRFQHPSPRTVLIVACLGAALAACGTATPYQPVGAPTSQGYGGYSDVQIQPDRWRVTFSGNDLTSRETVETYLLYRAAELTVQSGYDWFTTTQRSTDATTPGARPGDRVGVTMTASASGGVGTPGVRIPSSTSI